MMRNYCCTLPAKTNTIREVNFVNTYNNTNFQQYERCIWNSFFSPGNLFFIVNSSLKSSDLANAVEKLLWDEND